MEDPFERLSDEEIQARIDAAEARLLKMELEDMANGKSPDEIALEAIEADRQIAEPLRLPEDFS